MTNKNRSLFVTLAVAAAILTGCNVGNAPAGDSEAAMKEFSAMPAQKQIDFIKSSPMSAEEKKRRIAEIEQKTGAKDAGSTPAGQGVNH